MNIDIQQDNQPVIHTYLRRVKEGIRIDLELHPEIEEFFRHWGSTEQVNIGAYGKVWTTFPPPPQDQNNSLNAPPVLRAWTFAQPGPGNVDMFDLYGLGRSITNLSEKGQQNIAFLRLVGASQPGGITFLYEDIISKDGLAQLAARIRDAQIRFYDQYIRPAGMRILLESSINKTE